MGVGDRLLHGDVGVGQAVGEEPGGAAIDHGLPIDVRRGVDLAAEAEVRILWGRDDPGTGLAQGGEHLIGVVADRGDHAHAGDGHSTHLDSLSLAAPGALQTRSAALNSPTFKSRAS